jgi:hypothetical protein
LPLTFLIKIPNNNIEGSEDAKKQLYDVLRVMSQCAQEWQTLSLHIPVAYLHIFYDDSDFQSHLLTVRRLRIRCRDWWNDINRPVPPSNPKMNPEKIAIYDLSFQSLQISWNRLTSATVEGWDLEGIAQLFQRASQMTYCHISQLRCGPPNFAMPAIIHQGLQSLQFGRCQQNDAVAILLGSLTLPCLHAIQTDLSVAANIPALVHRSSCPLSRIAFYENRWSEFLSRPLPGVTDLVLKPGMHYVDDVASNRALLKKILLEGYFPDLRQLTLQSYLFPVLVDVVLPDVLNKLTLRKIFVRGADESNRKWHEKLKVFQSSISWPEDDLVMILLGVVSSVEDMLPPVP